MLDAEGSDMVCEAHLMLVQDIERLKNDENQLYTLDRERQAKLAEIQASIQELKTDNSYMKNEIKDLKKDITSIKTDVLEVKTDIAEVKKTCEIIASNNKKHWEPKDYATIIVAALALAGTVITAIF